MRPGCKKVQPPPQPAQKQYKRSQIMRSELYDISTKYLWSKASEYDIWYINIIYIYIYMLFIYIHMYCIHTWYAYVPTKNNSFHKTMMKFTWRNIQNTSQVQALPIHPFGRTMPPLGTRSRLSQFLSIWILVPDFFGQKGTSENNKCLQ